MPTASIANNKPPFVAVAAAPAAAATTKPPAVVGGPAAAAATETNSASKPAVAGGTAVVAVIKTEYQYNSMLKPAPKPAPKTAPKPPAAAASLDAASLAAASSAAAPSAAVPNPLNPPSRPPTRPPVRPRQPHATAPASTKNRPPTKHAALRGRGLAPALASPPSPAMAAAASSHHNPTISSVAARPSGATIEALLNEKRVMLASFEARFNEKILARHRELMEQQSSAVENSSPVDDKDHPMAKEVRRLKDELDEQKFSHEAELHYERDRVRNFEEELKKLKEAKEDDGDGTTVSANRPATPPTDFQLGVNPLADKLKELEDELQRERRLRIQQLKSLEMLHFAEFREIEKKHAEFVSHLVASYQKEIKANKAPRPEHAVKSTDDGNVVSSPPCESTEAAAAAAALSSMASPSNIEANNFEGEEDRSSVTVPIQLRQPASVDCGVPMPNLPPIENDKCTEETEKKAEMRPSKRSAPTVIDSGSEKDEPGPPAKKTRKKNEVIKQREQVEAILMKGAKIKQREQVEAILMKAGKMPPPRDASADNGNKKKKLSEEAKEYLKAWMLHPEHCDHPYPHPEEKAKIMADIGISFTELNNWFVNNRKRFWQQVVKPQIADIKKADRMQKMRESYAAAASTDV